MTLALIKDTIEEAISRRISQDPVHICWDLFRVEDFDLHGYIENVHLTRATQF